MTFAAPYSDWFFIVARFKPCPVELSYRPAHEDKQFMYNSVRSMKQVETAPKISPPPSFEPEGLPNSVDDQEGWITCDEPLLYVYAGKGPYVGRFILALLACPLYLIEF